MDDNIITVKQALALVKSNDYIVTGLGACEAREFLLQLHTIAENVKDVVVSNCLPLTDYEFFASEQYKESFSVEGWFYTSGLRKAHKNGNISFIPNHLHLSGIKRLACRVPNIYVGVSSMPDKHGFVSLSLSNTYEKRMFEAAEIKILEMNPNYPRTFGDVQVKSCDVNYFIATNYEVPQLLDAPINEKDKVIGKYIADLINDGDCLQLGIGGIPNAVADYLMDKKDLGIHTEMLTTGMMKLVKANVITGAKKQKNKNKIVTTFAMGTKELYDFIDDNPSIEFLDGNYVNDPAVIALNDNQVSINTTLEVDLTGQCASESLGSTQFSGTGGQADTAIGAQRSKNGRSIIALYSTAMVRNKKTNIKEEKSKIVCQLKQGAAVSLSRNDVDIVVTEYGVAHLRGTSIQERVKRLIAISNPKYHDELYQTAIELMLITKR